jgi:tetratricopeptide (TPR) repeat protein
MTLLSKQTALLLVFVAFVAILTVLVPTTAHAETPYKATVSIQGVTANADFMHGNRVQAENKLLNQLKADPNNPKLRGQLALIQAELYKLAAAESNALQVLRANPNNATALLAMGKIQWYKTTSSDMTYRLQKEALLETAASYFSKAVDASPLMPEAYTYLGQVALEQGNTSKARSAFESALLLDKTYADAWVQMARVSLLENRPTQALQQVEKAIVRNSKNDAAHYYKGQALLAQNNVQGALASLNTALSLNANSAPIHSALASAYNRQGNESAAIIHYKKATQIKPESTEAYQQLATLLSNRGDAELAIAELRNSLSVNGKHVPTLLALGKLALQTEKNLAAAEAFRSVLRVEPSNTQAAKGFACAYIGLAESETEKEAFGGSVALLNAEHLLQEGLTERPNDIDLQLALSKIQRLSGSPLQPESVLRKTLEAPATTDEQRLAQAEGLISLGEFEKAQALITLVVQNVAPNAENLLSVAETLLNMGALTDAKALYQKAEALGANTTTVERALARIKGHQTKAQQSVAKAIALNHWYKPQEKEQAKALLMNAIELDPWQAQAHEVLASLLKKPEEGQEAKVQWRAVLNLSPQLSASDRKQLEAKLKVPTPKTNTSIASLAWDGFNTNLN